MSSFIAEFKAFALKGNVLDLAIAVVIGAAFNKIVSSLVDNIITPLMGAVMGGVDFSGLAFVVGEAEVTYGMFIQSIIDFIIVALVLFVVIKGINRAKGIKKEEVKEEAAKPAPPSEAELLTEIRDLLKNKS